MGAAGIHAVPAPGACGHALAGAHRLPRSQPVCPVAAGRAAGGWSVGAGCGETVRRENGESNPCRRQGKPGEVLPGQPSYPKVKASRDKSMAVSGGSGEHARPNAPQDPRDRVKDGLLEPQPPAMDKHIPRHGMSGRGRPDRAVSLSPPETPPAERRPTRPFKGANRGPTSRYHVRLARTRDRLRVARPMATERS